MGVSEGWHSFIFTISSISGDVVNRAQRKSNSICSRLRDLDLMVSKAENTDSHRYEEKTVRIFNALLLRYG